MTRADISRVDFYFDDWLTGTFELSPEQRGAYITICSLIWKTGDQLKDIDQAMARWCGVSVRKWRALRLELIEAGKIAVEDGFIRQKRAATELENARDRRESAQRKGQKGGEKRAEESAKSLEKQEAESSTAQAFQHQYKTPSPNGDGQDKPARSLKGQLWSEMAERLEMSERKARELAGKWVKLNGLARVFEAHEAAKANSPADYRSYMFGALKSRPPAQGGRCAGSGPANARPQAGDDDPLGIDRFAVPFLTRPRMPPNELGAR